ncbi:MAG TPA: hypothetical protein VI076_15380 [Actinopolymorphaceae bacterium]
METITVPGVGRCHTLVSEHGQRLTIVAHHDGRRELIVNVAPEVNGDDEEQVRVPLSADEADLVAALLTSRRAWARLTGVGAT